MVPKETKNLSVRENQEREAALWKPALAAASELHARTGSLTGELSLRHEQVAEMERQTLLQREALQTSERLQRAGNFVGRVKNWWAGAEVLKAPDYSVSPSNLHHLDNPTLRPSLGAKCSLDPEPEPLDELSESLGVVESSVRFQSHLLAKQNSGLDTIKQATDANSERAARLAKNLDKCLS